MKSGEKEMRQIFEDTTTNNVKATVEFTNETRKLFRELQIKVNLLQDRIVTQDTTIALMKKQISNMQAIVFRGGSS